VTARPALLVAMVLVAGCAGHGTSGPRSVAETRAAFAHHGIKLVPDRGGDGPGVRFFQDHNHRFSVAVYSTVEGAERRERLYRASIAGLAALATSGRARNVFVTWALGDARITRSALEAVVAAVKDLR
jgi:hypothetical protein